MAKKKTTTKTKTASTSVAAKNVQRSQREDFIWRLNNTLSSAARIIHVSVLTDPVIVEGYIKEAGQDHQDRWSANQTSKEKATQESFVWTSLGASWAPGAAAGADANAEMLDNPFDALRSIRELPSSAVIFYDLDSYLYDRSVPAMKLRRLLISMYNDNTIGTTTEYARPLILISRMPGPPEELQEYCDVVAFAPPSCETLETFLKESLPKTRIAGKKLELEPAMLKRVASDSVGMSLAASRRAVLFAIHQNDLKVDEGIHDTIIERKVQDISRIDGLSFIPRSQITSAEKIGGFDLFKAWLQQRRHAYSADCDALKLDLPRGCALFGIPGTGKTMAAKTAASILGLDLLSLDIGSIFGKYVGESEARLRTALKYVEAIPNAVLMIDELDKSLGGAQGSVGDSGVSSRVLSYMLNWLSERKYTHDNTFVIVTMNRIDTVPPELLRVGRFDRLWFTDLPGSKERRQILAIHMEMRGIPEDSYNDTVWETLVDHTIGFTGAELEEIVISAKHAMHARIREEGKIPTLRDLVPRLSVYTTILEGIHAVIRTRAGEVNAIRRKCREVAEPVSSDFLAADIDGPQPGDCQEEVV